MTDQDQSEQERARQLVHREVRVCLSSLVSTLAQGYGMLERDTNRDLSGLTEQAFELATPIPDYEEAAIYEGWSTRDGLFIHNAGTPDEDATSSGSSPDDANGWENLCAEHGIEPYEREVFEFWAVSDWFGRKLADQGEKVDFDFAGMTVWARTTTGQAIYCDGVVERIVTDLWKPEPTEVEIQDA